MVCESDTTGSAQDNAGGQAAVPATYTAAQIARASSLTRQTIHGGLAQMGTALGVDSQGARGFSELPMDWQLEITRRGVKRGFENGEKYLASLPLTPWQSPLTWDRVQKREQDKAVRLQKALARALALRMDGSATAAQVEEAGLADFRAQFGYAISARHWRRLVNRTIERDGGEENWQRMEIYLDDRAFAVVTPKPEVLRNEYRHRELDDVIAALEDRQHPTAEDRRYILDAAFRHYEQHTEALTDSPTGNRVRRLFKASLVNYLFKAFPDRTLSATASSLKRRFDEKLVLWRAKGCTPAALQDRRPLWSGNFNREDFAADLKKIRNQAIQLDGNESLARRMLHERGELSQEFCSKYPYDARQNKSDLPDSVRNRISPEVNMCLALRRGPWQARMRGPYIPRDWSDVKPGDWFNADNVTWNHYFKEQIHDGRWVIMRGECLLMTDLRTGYPLGFLLISGHYNSEHVRRLALKVHDRVGLPRFGFYFEKGVWASRLVTGDSRHGTPVHWREAENGLCSADLKLEVRHATTPRAKPIEGLLRILQERMRLIFGFVGFNERQYDAERIQRLKLRAERGDPEALAQIPTAGEWAAQISQVLDDFAHDPQNGKMLEGRAPAEAWAEEIRQRPLRQLPDEARYILSTHQKRVTVRQEGILMTIRGKQFLYFNEHTGPLIGREVLAFYNLEMPELLTVCDMKRQNYFSVRRVELPGMSATRQQLEEVNRLRKAHMAHAKSIFGELRHEVVSTISRDTECSEESRSLGRFHNQRTAKAKAEKSATTRKLRSIQLQAAAEGIAVSPSVRNPDRVQAGIELIKKHRGRILQAEQGEDHTNG